LLFQAILGYSRKRDVAWFFHVPACLATLAIYGFGKVEGIFTQKEMSRENWKQ
jgi:hypothetical protein